MNRGVVAALGVLLATGFLALGVWQIERREQKLALIARVDARTHAAPQPLPPPANWARIDGRDYAYTRIRARGAFLHDRETLVQAVTVLGPGWWVLTPFRTSRGIVLINRGFVPPERRDPATRRAGSADGLVTITGMARTSEPSGGFLRANDPVAGRWYSRDVGAIAPARGLSGIAPFFVDADATPNPGGFPVGGLTVVAFANSHLVYALTWFALAGLVLFALYRLFRPERAHR